MTVNQRVAGSSPAGGATLDKPSEMMAFSLSIGELGELHLSSVRGASLDKPSEMMAFFCLSLS